MGGKEKKSLINVDVNLEFLAPVSEQLSKLLGIWIEPKYIKRLAEAKSEAKRIDRMDEIQDQLVSTNETDKIHGLLQRAERSALFTEAVKQNNFENIIAKAASKLMEQSKNQEFDPDWLMEFFENSRKISNEEMQSLWASILAGEANQSGSFSKQTIDIVRRLDKKNAQLFSTLCSFRWSLSDYMLFIYDYRDERYEGLGIDFISLSQLENLGLIGISRTPGYILTGEKGQFIGDQKAVYFDKSVELNLAKIKKVEGGEVILTEPGKELCAVCEVSFNQDHYDMVLENWKKAGILKVLPEN